MKILPAGTTHYLFDGIQVLEERDGSDTITRQYVWGNGIDHILQETTASATFYAHENSIGSIAALTDTSGTAIERYRYDPFGNTTLTLDSATGNRHRFHGAYFDDETSLYYMRARYYSPMLGRFLQRDPIGIWTDAPNLGNGLAFVASDPVNRRDPSGLEEKNPKDKSPVVWIAPGYYGCRVARFEGEWLPTSPREPGRHCVGYDVVPLSYLRLSKNKQEVLDAAVSKKAFQFSGRHSSQDVLDYVRIVHGLKEPEKDPGWSALRELLKITGHPAIEEEGEPRRLEVNACAEWVKRVDARYDEYLKREYYDPDTLQFATMNKEIRKTFEIGNEKWNVVGGLEHMALKITLKSTGSSFMLDEAILGGIGKGRRPFGYEDVPLFYSRMK